MRLVVTTPTNVVEDVEGADALVGGEVLDVDAAFGEVADALGEAAGADHAADVGRDDHQFLVAVMLLDVGHDSWDMYSDWWVWNSFHPAAVAAPPIMALLILLIACFNITNSSIAISSRRLKEIGVRKVSGGHRKNIIIQFMTENFILTLLGLLLSLVLAGWLTDVYSRMWDYMDLDFSLVDNPPLVLFLVLLGFLIIFTESSAVAPFIYTLF